MNQNKEKIMTMTPEEFYHKHKGNDKYSYALNEIRKYKNPVHEKPYIDLSIEESNMFLLQFLKGYTGRIRDTASKDNTYYDLLEVMDCLK